MTEPMKEEGRELDALIAERVTLMPREKWRSRCYVMRHRFDDYEFDSVDQTENGWCYTCAKWVGDVQSAGDVLPPRYSTTEWMLVVDAMRARGFEVQLVFHQPHPHGGDNCRAMIGHPDNEDAHGEVCAATMPVAICLASLEAIGAISDDALMRMRLARPEDIQLHPAAYAQWHPRVMELEFAVASARTLLDEAMGDTDKTDAEDDSPTFRAFRLLDDALRRTPQRERTDSSPSTAAGPSPSNPHGIDP